MSMCRVFSCVVGRDCWIRWSSLYSRHKFLQILCSCSHLQKKNRRFDWIYGYISPGFSFLGIHLIWEHSSYYKKSDVCHVYSDASSIPPFRNPFILFTFRGFYCYTFYFSVSFQPVEIILVHIQFIFIFFFIFMVLLPWGQLGKKQNKRKNKKPLSL